MRIVTLLMFFVAAAIAIPDSAYAARKAGVTMPDTITTAGKQLRLNGMGLREATPLKLDVYVAGLYLETPSSNAAEILATKETKVLVLRFVRDVDRSDIVKAWNDGFKNNSTVDVAKLQPHIAKLESWAGDFKKGQTVVFTHVPGQGVAIEIDRQRKGMINDDEFARSLFAIWLGHKPPGQGLKNGLLGK